MQGRMVDIEKLRSANENVQAVGNMNVNARGDVLGAGGKIVTTKSKVIQKYYEHPKGKASEARAPITHTPAPQPIAQQTVVETEKLTPKVAPKLRTTKAVPKKTASPKKGIDEALDGLE